MEASRGWFRRRRGWSRVCLEHAGRGHPRRRCDEAVSFRGGRRRASAGRSCLLVVRSPKIERNAPSSGGFGVRFSPDVRPTPRTNRSRSSTRAAPWLPPSRRRRSRCSARSSWVTSTTRPSVFFTIYDVTLSSWESAVEIAKRENLPIRQPLFFDSGTATAEPYRGLVPDAHKKDRAVTPATRVVIRVGHRSRARGLCTSGRHRGRARRPHGDQPAIPEAGDIPTLDSGVGSDAFTPCADRTGSFCRSPVDFPCDFEQWVPIVANKCQHATGCMTNSWSAREVGSGRLRCRDRHGAPQRCNRRLPGFRSSRWCAAPARTSRRNIFSA